MSFCKNVFSALVVTGVLSVIGIASAHAAEEARNCGVIITGGIGEVQIGGATVHSQTYNANDPASGGQFCSSMHDEEQKDKKYSCKDSSYTVSFANGTKKCYKIDPGPPVKCTEIDCPKPEPVMFNIRLNQHELLLNELGF
jgi:hypothetical protein